MKNCICSFAVSSYGIFAAISTLLKQDMSGHLGVIVGFLMDSLQSTEGIKVKILIRHALLDFSQVAAAPLRNS